MLKEASIPGSNNEEIIGKCVEFYVDAKLLALTGNWEWDMHCDKVFCSDVMAALSQPYEGTKGIIYPEDIAMARLQLEQIKYGPVDISFRMITTYGDVQKISGENCVPAEDYLTLHDPGKYLLEKEATLNVYAKGYDNYWQLKEVMDLAEKINKSGWWVINSTTNETFYSDNVYRIHGIIPQSLNAHLNTFNTFIHPDDSVAFFEAFDKAFKEKTCLHLEYRIIVAEETTKYITLVTHWSHNNKGEDILNGLIRDETESTFALTLSERATYDLDFYKKILQQTEINGNTGYWYMNLVTRQTYYSDNYYRIHGLKPQSLSPGPATFLNYVHADDREKVLESIHEARIRHVVPEFEYRIVRSDKMSRYIRQKGSVISYANFELIMVCSIQDVTLPSQIDKNSRDLKQALEVKEIMHFQSEQMSNSGTWIWELENRKILWSDNIYEILGSKKGVQEFTEEGMIKSVLPEDRKAFNDELRFVQEGMGERQLHFRILRGGNIRTIKGNFKIIKYQDRKFFIASIQDITEIISIQQSLNEQLQLNQMFIENIQDRVFITDINNTIILWNKKCEEYTHLKREQLHGKNYFDIFPENKNELTITRFNAVLKGETLHEFNERSGARKYHDLHMIPLKEKGNAIVGILHILHDVSRESQLKTNLSHRLKFIEKLLEETVDRIIVLDKNYNFLYWNKKAETHYHINKEYVTGKNVLEVFPSFVHDPLYDKCKKILTGEIAQYTSMEESIHQEKFSEIYLLPLPGDHNEITAVLWIVHDLSKAATLQIVEEKIRK